MAWRKPDLPLVHGDRGFGVEALARLVVAHPPVVVLAGAGIGGGGAGPAHGAIRALQEAGIVADVIADTGDDALQTAGVRHVVDWHGTVALAEAVAANAGLLLTVGAGIDHPLARRAQRAAVATAAELQRVAARVI
jgi:hypothetical protein